jgi:hypothetical protein
VKTICQSWEYFLQCLQKYFLITTDIAGHDTGC